MTNLYDLLSLIENNSEVCKNAVRDFENNTFECSDYSPMVQLVVLNYVNADNTTYFKQLIHRDILKLFKILEY